MPHPEGEPMPTKPPLPAGGAREKCGVRSIASGRVGPVEIEHAQLPGNQTRRSLPILRDPSLQKMGTLEISGCGSKNR